MTTQTYCVRDVLIAERAYECALRASEGFSIRASDGFPDLAPASRPPCAIPEESAVDSGAPP